MVSLPNDVIDPDHCEECRDRATEHALKYMTPLEEHLLATIQLIIRQDVDDRVTLLAQKATEPARLLGQMKEPWRDDQPENKWKTE